MCPGALMPQPHVLPSGPPRDLARALGLGLGFGIGFGRHATLALAILGGIALVTLEVLALLGNALATLALAAGSSA